ncbi:MAG: hypothetical protein ACFFG0_03950 [Candidatus Thorarchaeota archaeon]
MIILELLTKGLNWLLTFVHNHPYFSVALFIILGATERSKRKDYILNKIQELKNNTYKHGK